MPSKSKGSFTPNSNVYPEQDETDSPFSTNPPGKKHSTPQKYAVSPEERHKLRKAEIPVMLASDSEGYQESEKKPSCCHKYSNALKTLLPFRPSRKDKSKLPSNRAGFISFVSLTWLTKLMWKAFRKGLQESDLWKIQDEDSSRVSYNRLNDHWENEKKIAKEMERTPDLWRAAWRMTKTRVIISLGISLLMNILQFIGPSIFLKMTLDYINEAEIDHIYGAKLVAAILAINIVRGTIFNLMFIIATHSATRVVAGTQALIFDKVLKLKTGGEKLSAQIINILNNDMERLFESVIAVVFITASPVIFVLSTIYSSCLIGPWALLGCGIYLMFYPIMGMIAKCQSQIRLKTVKITDKRVSLMSEILNSLRLIKIYAWEESFGEKIADIRHSEIKRHRLGALLQAVSSTAIPSISILATITTLLGYTLSGNSLQASNAFTIFSVFYSMTFTMGVLPYAIRSIAEARISFARIQKLMEMPEHTKHEAGLVNNNLALMIKSATFAWEIHSIDLKLQNQQGKKETKESKGKKNKANTKDATNNDEKNNLIQNKDIADPSPDTKLPVDLDEMNDTRPVSNGGSPAKEEGTPQRTIRKGSTEITETLFGVNLSIGRGKLVGMCGSVGAGKSSIISAICGDMQLQTGQLQVNGRLALVSQQAWIYNATLRENILVGLPYDQDRYNHVVDVCSLREDVDLLPSGDMTEIGEKGVNLSGGQKQRVNLARAVYSNRDIYLLDDPLSAVDTKVAQKLFTDCIKGELKAKTVLLVTHGTHFLEYCDDIILMKGGRICERGTHQDLMKREGEYSNMVSFDSSERSEPGPVTIDNNNQITKKKKEVKSEDDGKMMQEETKEIGSVGAKVYLTFARVCGGWGIVLIIFLATSLFTLTRIFSVIWLQRWIDAGDGLEAERRENMTLYNMTFTDDELKGDIILNPHLWIYQIVYGTSFIALVITGVVKGVGIAFSILAGATRLHYDMFKSLMRSPMSFLDTTPVGRILTRFSRDLDELDVRIPFFFEFVCQGMLVVLGQIIMVSYFFPVFVFPLLAVIVLFICLDIFLNAGVRELKRLDNTLKSPVIQHLSASISGLSVIRSLDREKEFMRRFIEYVDRHSIALMIFRLSNRWFTYRMDLMATLVTISITIICVFTKGQFSTATAGLALSTISGVCGFIPFLMRMKSEFQSRLTSVERIIEYAYEIPSEAPMEIEDGKSGDPWPSSGYILFEEVRMRYRPELPHVLHGVNVSINCKEKIGVIGRTGAGKSSLISCLLRLVELDSGRILIDGVDISTIGLHKLRSAISVIPQDPILFQGTIRYNLDPFSKHSDDDLWIALERSHLKSAVTKLPKKLLSEVEAQGENFSVGEKQLICLTRALLRDTKVLLLDEATASVDVETDHLIQTTLKEAFSSCTLITIAHRLNTIANYDRIMVMSEGNLIEFDSPMNLMNKESSHFKQMMEAMGVYTIQHMLALK